MSTNKQTGKTVGKVIAYILVLLVVAGVIAVIVRFTGGFTSDFKTFYVSVDGKDVLTSAGGYEVTNEKPLTVDVKYAVEGKDFDFTLDDQVYSFQAETDLTAGFDIAREETSFTITPKGGVTEVLRAVYPNNEIGDCSDKGYEDMYALIVTSYNGKASVTLYFSVLQEVAGVTLDQEVIEF